MSDADQTTRIWPEDEQRAVPPSRPRSWLVRFGRALGDAFLTIGMSKGVSGEHVEDNRAMTNVILFGEGASKGREAGLDSPPEPPRSPRGG